MEEKARKYIQLAQINAQLFSKDPHTKVGCIILTSDFSRILSTGINGFPRGLNDNLRDRWNRPQKYQFVCHAESNGIANAARTGTPLDGAVIVVTKFPCSNCAKLLIQSGISKVYSIKGDYTDPTWGEDIKISEELFREVGIDVCTFVPNSMSFV